ncbi:MAG: tetratricopeptide repeat protein [Boseongicola sp.]|nr:tetratricopeptide repeat protein [Boseongicola sp.]
MSEQDSFINEVSEEVRKDRLYRLFKRYGWIAALAIVVIVGGAAWNEWRKAQATAAAQAAGDAILAAFEGDAESRAAELAEIDAGDNASRGAILMLMRAEAALANDDVTGAVALLESLARDTDAPASYRDLATLKAVILGAGTTEPEERIARLNALALGGGAFRLMASEQIALAEIEMGDAEAALTRLREINADAETSQDLRRRASQLIVALGGSLTDG